jgi:CheY-like chemotaxis protein
LEAINLNDVVSRCVDGFDRRLTMYASVRYDLVESLPCVRGDFDQLCRVLSSLVENAGQSIVTANGSIVVATGVMHIDNAHLAGAYLAEDLPEGMYAYLRVADNGCGMDDVAVEHVFDPFYSTKGPGRGLGLAWVAGVVRSHRGAIIVNSEPARGSTFTAIFPAEFGSNRSSPAAGTLDDDWVDSGSIVVVDDEPAVRSVIKLLVERRGFDVSLARDGVEGLDILEQTRSTVRAVLLDLNMPRMGGEEMFEVLRRRRPDLPVVIMTGTADHRMVERLRAKPRVRVLHKPFRAAALMEQLRALLYDPERQPTAV